MLLRLLEVDNREMAKINLRDLCSFRCYDVFGNSPSPSNRTRWTVLILFAFFLDTILLCLGMKPFFMPFPFAECAGTSDGEGTSGTTPLIPCREDSPVPSISSQGSSWIEGLYGTTGDEIASHSNPPSSRPQAENPDPQDNEAKKLSAQPPVEIEEELPVPTIQEVKEEMRHFFNHFRKNQTPDRFINSTAEEISLAQASAAKRRAIVQLMDEIAENSSTITQGGGVVASAQDARAELTERLDRWAGEHET